MHHQAVILAGGKGTRLWPLTKDLPKPLVDVAGKPFLYWQLRYLKEQGVSEALLLVSHMAEKVRDYFLRHPVEGLKIDFCLEETPLGTGGALAHALPQLDENFWLLNGDSFLYIELPQMAELCRQNPWNACMATTNRELVPVPGNVHLEGNVVLEYKRDGGFEHVDAGVYLLSRQVVEKGPRGTFDLGELWPTLIASQRLGSFAVHERFFDIGTPERLKTFAAHVAGYF